MDLLSFLGIDLGTTNSTVAEAMWDPAAPDSITVKCLEIDQATRQGTYTHVLVPSVVAIHDGKVVVGEGAKELVAMSCTYGLDLYKNLFRECKNDIGTRKAHENGRLVIFAGAGVSMAPPTCAPNFCRLVEELKGGTGLEQIAGEPYPDYLGRLSRIVDVHPLTRSILHRYNKVPSRLHDAIINLFQTSSSVRIVTTNFDTLFSTACINTFGKNADIFCAPHPPTKSDFDGIVHLHGSLAKEDHLILTDADYGQAYLSEDEGWASRFLRRLFREYTVLFIGYSHADMPVKYLERGFSSDIERKRFALTDLNDTHYWKGLGITPILYPSDEQHSALHGALRFWGKILDSDYLKHEERIRAIVAQDPPENGDNLNYLEFVLNHKTLIRFFTRHARGIKWLEFVERQKALAPLFRVGLQSDDLSRVLAWWFADNFVFGHPSEALDLVGRNRQSMNWELWRAIAHTVWVRKPETDPDLAASWIVVLTQSAYCETSDGMLEYLMDSCRYPEDYHSAIVILDSMIHPRLTVRKYRIEWPGHEQQPGRMHWDVALCGDMHYLNNAWDKLFHPNLQAFIDKLFPMLESSLRQIYTLLNSVRQIGEDWDPISWRRQRIWQDHNEHDNEVEFIITALRQMLEFRISSQPSIAESTVKDWWRSDMLVFKRLALFGISKSAAISSEDKIRWLLQQNLLYKLDYKADVFHLLETAYPFANMDIRNELLESALQGPSYLDIDNDDQRQLNAYEVYNLLYWIHSVAPECSAASAAFEGIKTQHLDFGPRKHPDLDHWTDSGSYVAPLPPKTVDELLSEDPREPDAIRFLIEYTGENTSRFHSERTQLLKEVSAAVKNSREWQWNLVDALVRHDEWHSDLWDQIVQVWKSALLSIAEWRRILTFISEHEPLRQNKGKLLAEFLKDAISRTDNRIPKACFAQAEDIAYLLWRLDEGELDGSAIDADSFYFTASNTSSGLFVEFLIWVISHKRQQSGEKWKGIPNKEKKFLGQVLACNDIRSRTGSTVLAREIQFLFNIDQAWSVSNLIPLFNWSVNEEQATSVWHGFLSQNRIGETLFAALLPYYRQSMDRVSGWSDMMRQVFAGHIAGTAVFSGRNPVSEGWLLDYIKNGDLKDRKEFASAIQQIIHSLDADAVTKLWNSWLDDYWKQRLAGRPLPIDAQESDIMLNWVLHLFPVFPEAVARACQMLSPSDRYALVIWNLADDEYVAKYPQPTADLLGYILESSDGMLFDYQRIDQMVRLLVDTGADSKSLRKICSLISPHYAEAAELAKLIDGRSEPGSNSKS